MIFPANTTQKVKRGETSFERAGMRPAAIGNAEGSFAKIRITEGPAASLFATSAKNALGVADPSASSLGVADSNASSLGVADLSEPPNDFVAPAGCQPMLAKHARSPNHKRAPTRVSIRSLMRFVMTYPLPLPKSLPIGAGPQWGARACIFWHSAKTRGLRAR